MFERFSQTARQVVVNAQEQARSLAHRHIGTEHVLLGVLSNDDSAACQTLNGLGVTLQDARERVVKLVAGDDSEYPATGQIPFTARAKAVLESAIREASNLGHQTITPEHLLVGLTREQDGVAIRILLDCGTNTTAIRDALLPKLPRPDPADVPPARATVAARQPLPTATARPALSAVSFEASPDGGLRRFLMSAAGRALTEGRTQFGIMDLLDVLADEPDARGALAELGIDHQMLRAAIRRSPGSHGPPEAQ